MIEPLSPPKLIESDLDSELSELSAEGMVPESPLSRTFSRVTYGAERRRSSRPDEGQVLEQFRRLRGPAEALRDGDREALREHLVMIHAPLVEHCARTLSSSEDLLEDLVQEGNIGLIKAVDRYDPEKGVRFSTYACHLITGEMRHYLRDLGKIIHEPGWHSELRRQVERAAEDLVQRLGRPPRPEEVGHALDMQPQVVRKVLESSNTLSVSSLDAEDEDEESPAKVRLFDEGDHSLPQVATSVEDRIALSEALPQLREQEKRAVMLFYYGEKSKTEIARELSVSVNYAAYLIKKGLEQLRKLIENEASQHSSSPSLPSTIAWNDLPRWIDEHKSSLSRASNSAHSPARSLDTPNTNHVEGHSNGQVEVAAQNGHAHNEFDQNTDDKTESNQTSNGQLGNGQIGNRQAKNDVNVLYSAARTSGDELLKSVAHEDSKDQSTKNEYSMLLFRIANWREVTAHFDANLCRESDRLVTELTRRSCRKSDKVVTIEGAPFGGLALVALVGGGEIVGQRVRERWMKACDSSAVVPKNAAVTAELQKQFVVASAPRDGAEPRELVQKLEHKLTQLAPDAETRSN